MQLCCVYEHSKQGRHCMKRFPRGIAFLILAYAFALPLHATEPRQNSLGMTFVFIPPDEFRMGTSLDEAEIIAREMETPDASRFLDEAPVHRVIISTGFWLGESEVTQGQWHRLMGDKPGPAAGWEQPDWESLPVVSVSWDMAQQFLTRLNERDEQFRYRLPTEAEWEYAARAGSTATRPVPVEQLGDYAWFIENSGDVPHPVASRKPNAFGLYDMLGNAWEWVNDRYHPDTYTKATRTDPTGPAQGASRVRRGGSYHCPLFQTRPAYRSANAPDTAYSVIGFRVVAE
jgi:sulfatase modifying factor 1